MLKALSDSIARMDIFSTKWLILKALRGALLFLV